VTSGDQAAELIERFLDGRPDRTRRAYRADIEEFARFLESTPTEAIARLIRVGSRAAGGLAMDFAVDVRRRGLAQSTVNRRLATLRALLGAAADAGAIDWALDTPTHAEVDQALFDRAASGVPYMLPRHPSEIHRLDVQHYALQAAVGKPYLAPIERAGRALDVGTGSGQWAFDLCTAFPDALVVGLDLVPGKQERPQGYRWVRANLLAGLPFRDASFDFVYQRFLASGVPVAAWPAAVAELVRVTRPGGWIELTESVMGMTGLGPANTRIMGLAQEIASRLGLDTDRVICDSVGDYLRAAGAVDVVRREVSLPIGQWGGQVGALMAADMRAACSRLCEMHVAQSRMTAEECRELLGRALEEWEHFRPTWTVGIAWGRRP
jgi:SAM-dependent methyltransferase